MTASHPKLISAADGRRVAFDVYGVEDGPPVFYLHGVPSGRLEVHVFGLPEAARRAGVSLVVLDRAGIGHSDPQPGRSLVDTAGDVAAVADVLGYPRFGLVGYSAGSPFALATAHVLRDRVTALGIVSGIAPADRPELLVGQSEEVARMFRWARSHPRRLRGMLRLMQIGTRRPAAMTKAAAKGAPAKDVAVLTRDGAAEAFAAFLAAAFRQGIDGVATDFRLAAGPWNVPLAELDMPVDIWHGDRDRNAPAEAARWLAANVPARQLQISTDDGHASVISAHGTSILSRFADT